MSVLDPIEALKEAIELVGSQAELARRISTAEHPVKQQHVWNWLNRDKKVPAEVVLPIERATLADGSPRVTRYRLRPDLYPYEEPIPKQSALFS